MDVSINGGTQQPWVFLPKMIILDHFGVFWGYPYFWKHPYNRKTKRNPTKIFFFRWIEPVCLFHLCQVYPLSISKFFQEAMLAILPGHGFHSVKLGNTSAIVQRWDMEKRLRADRLRG